MNGVGGYGLFVIVWGAVVVAAALAISIFVSFGDGRRRYRERQRDRSLPSGAKLWRLFPPRLVVLLVCIVAGIGALFAVAEHTITSVEVEHPWLG